MAAISTVLFNGVAYGFLLFVMSVGLSVSLGMMNFVNLAQASFSMLGGYILVTAMQGYGVPFLLCLPIVFVLVGAFAVVVERLIFRYFYQTDDLTQVLLTIGLVFMSIAMATYIWGGSYQRFDMPSWIIGQKDVFGLTLETYRIFLVGFGAD